MNRSGIRVRLTFWYSVVLLCGLALFGGAVWLAMCHQTIADVDSAVRNRARGLEDYLRVEEAEDPTTLEHELGELRGSLPANDEVEILSPDKKSLFATLDAPSLFRDLRDRVGRLGSAGEDLTQEVTGRRRHYRALAHPAMLNRRQYWIFAAASTDEALHTDQQLGYLLLAAIPGVVLLAAFGGYVLSARAIAPVAAMTNAARQIGIEDLSRRLPVPRAGDEIQQLAETWNDMLARLEVAVTRISQFTSDASHELRSPIALIRSTAEIALRRERPESQYREALQQIEAESEQMTNLVGDLLFLARADDYSIFAEMTEVDLRQPVQEACAQVAPLASARHLTVELQEFSAPIPVIGYASSLRRMILAILENAVKYTPAQGSIAIHLEGAAKSTKLVIRDTGIGIPQADLPHVFERFYRADPSRNRSSGGHGLGLSIAQTIARHHRGSIEVESQVGEGSSFVITLPSYSAADRANDSRAASTVLARSSSE